MPLPVPAILGHSDDAGHARARGSRRRHAAGASGATTPTEHAALYRQAVAFIAVLQRRGARARVRPATCPYGIAFDVEKLTWELDFFVKHFLEAYRGAALSDVGAGGARARNGRRSPTSWRPSRACCAIATITAAT